MALQSFFLKNSNFAFSLLGHILYGHLFILIEAQTKGFIYWLFMNKWMITCV